MFRKKIIRLHVFSKLFLKIFLVLLCCRFTFKFPEYVPFFLLQLLLTNEKHNFTLNSLFYMSSYMPV